jgi:gamma-glutamyltranspeptidase / glutathione hydrolase
MRITEFRNFEQSGHSEVFGANGMVATSHPYATLAALDVLRDGGNAVDAAVCAAAAQAVVEPTQTGLGGDCFALVMREGDSKPIALNGSGWAPAGAGLDWYVEHGISEIAIESPHAVTIPGAVAAWDRLVTDYGTMPLERLFVPAIEAAEQGCPVPERLARDWGRQVAKLRRNRAAAQLFLFGGEPPRPGEIHRQPALAKTLRSIAKDGAGVFYRGWIADQSIKTLRALGGLHALDDFASFTPEYVTPISVDYRSYTLWECPPNGQGLVPMVMAKALEGYEISRWAPASIERLHVQGEIGRLAYAERDIFIGDPRTGKIPVARLLSAEHAAQMRRRISMNGRIANADPIDERPHKDTVFIAVVDRDRTAVALISSIYEDFGCGIADAETGFVFHNRGTAFVLDRNHPNAIAGRKRPMHTIIPAMLAKNGQAVMPFGVTGAHFQPFGQIQILTNIVDYGMRVQRAIDFPRMFARGDSFEIERTVPDAIASGLEALGHRITRPENPLGTAQAIWIDREAGILRGGADGRRDGIALGF